jgi:hypothetical protein
MNVVHSSKHAKLCLQAVFMGSRRRWYVLEDAFEKRNALVFDMKQFSSIQEYLYIRDNPRNLPVPLTWANDTLRYHGNGDDVSY